MTKGTVSEVKCRPSANPLQRDEQLTIFFYHLGVCAPQVSPIHIGNDEDRSSSCRLCI